MLHRAIETYRRAVYNNQDALFDVPLTSHW